MSDETNEAGAPESTERPPSTPASGAATRRTGGAKPTPRPAVPASGRPQLRELRTAHGHVWHCWEAGVTVEPIEAGVRVYLSGADPAGYLVEGNVREVAQQLGLDW